MFVEPSACPLFAPDISRERIIRREKLKEEGRMPEAAAPDPVIAGLVRSLPPAGTAWPMLEQLIWLRMLAVTLKTVYGGKGEIKIEWQEALPRRSPPASLRPLPPLPERPVRKSVQQRED